MEQPSFVAIKYASNPLGFFVFTIINIIHDNEQSLKTINKTSKIDAIIDWVISRKKYSTRYILGPQSSRFPTNSSDSADFRFFRSIFHSIRGIMYVWNFSQDSALRIQSDRSFGSMVPQYFIIWSDTLQEFLGHCTLKLCYGELDTCQMDYCRLCIS